MEKEEIRNFFRQVHIGDYIDITYEKDIVSDNGKITNKKSEVRINGYISRLTARNILLDCSDPFVDNGVLFYLDEIPVNKIKKYKTIRPNLEFKLS